jgi:hypothetical protein
MARLRDIVSGRIKRWKQAPAKVIDFIREGAAPPDAILRAAKDLGLDPEKNPKDGYVLLWILADILYGEQGEWVASQEGKIRKRGRQPKWTDEELLKLERRLKAIDLAVSGTLRKHQLEARLKEQHREDYGDFKKGTLMRRFPPKYQKRK